MTLLIVFSSILAYIFIGLVVGKVWKIKSIAKCAVCTHAYGRCRFPHRERASAAGLLWPVGPLLVLICIALSQSSTKIAHSLTKNDRKAIR